MAKNKFYAIRVGRKTGIFNSWDECSELVRNFSGAEYKSFSNIDDANEYMNPNGERTIVENLAKYCRENSLGYTAMLDIFSGRKSIYKGWTKIC